MSETISNLLAQEAFVRFIVFVGFVMISTVLWVFVTVRNTRLRRLARAQGLPNPPGTFTEFRRYAVGLFKNMFNNDPNKKDQNNPLDEDGLPMPDLDFVEEDAIFGELVDDAPAPTPRPAAPPPMPQQAPPPVAVIEDVPDITELPTDAVEVLRVWRDVEDGSIIVQMGDHYFRSYAQMQKKGANKRFMNVMQHLIQITNAGRTSGLRPPTAPTPHIETERWAAQTAKTPETAIPEPGAGLGIAAQIDKFLQASLGQNPIFFGRTIRIGSNPDGTLKIMVDNGVYGGIDEVPDLAVRDFLQQTIREWENSH